MRRRKNTNRGLSGVLNAAAKVRSYFTWNIQSAVHSVRLRLPDLVTQVNQWRRSTWNIGIQRHRGTLSQSRGRQARLDLQLTSQCFTWNKDR